MKNLSKIAFTICLSLLFFTCNENDNKLQEEQLIDNSETIKKIINIYDHTIKATYGSKKISEKEISSIFLKEAEKQNLLIKQTNNTLRKSKSYYDQSSEEYKQFAKIIVSASKYSSKEEYQKHLNNLLENVKNSNINISEKQILVDNILLTNAFINWTETLSSDNIYAKRPGWWIRWGRCVAGILGGAGTGALTFGLAGAAVGTIALPIVGTVSAGLVGAIGGAVAGGLTGAAASC